MTVWLVQSVCENNHCRVAALYDAAIPESAESARAMIERRVIENPSCAHCGTSQFSLTQGRTIFRSLAEGVPIMVDPSTRAAQPPDLLAYLNERCCMLLCGKTYHGACQHELCPRRKVR